MWSLESLKKASLKATRFGDLISIAAYSASPPTAYMAAKKMGWYEDKAKGCEYMAMILWDYGKEAFVDFVEKENKDYKKETDCDCFCDCHIQKFTLINFVKSEWPKSDCKCCNTYSWCFYPAHTFNRDCPICDSTNGDDGNDEDQCDNCSGGACNNCNCYECEGPNCSGCSENDRYGDCRGCKCDGCNGDECDRCECRDCDHSEYEGDEEDNQSCETVFYLSDEDRVSQITEKVSRASGQNLSAKVVRSIDGDRINASVKRDGSMEVTSGLAEKLTDDELAWVIAHEAAHVENKHIDQRVDLIEAGVRKSFDGAGAVMSSMKESGHGIITRGLAGIATIAAGVAGTYVVTQGLSREHEKEADVRALDITKEAGYDPNAATSALNKIDHGGNRSLFDEIKASHPTTSDRKDNLKK